MTKDRGGQRFAVAEQQRYGAHLPKTPLIMDQETGWVSASGEDAAPVKYVKEQIIRQNIMAALKGGPKAITQLRAAVKGRNEEVSATLKQMVEGGDLCMDTKGRAKKYRLTVGKQTNA